MLGNESLGEGLDLITGRRCDKDNHVNGNDESRNTLAGVGNCGPPPFLAGGAERGREQQEPVEN